MTEEERTPTDPEESESPIPEAAPMPDQAAAPAGSGLRRGWIITGALAGLAAGIGAHFALSSTGDNETPSSQQGAPVVSVSPEESTALFTSALDDLEWHDGTPTLSHGSSYPDAVALEEASEPIAPLWAIEVLGAGSYSESLTTTVVYLLDPDGQRYEVLNIPASAGKGLAPIEWDPPSGRALLWNDNSYEPAFVLIDIETSQWASIVIEAEDLNLTRIGRTSDGTSMWSGITADVSAILAWDFESGWIPRPGDVGFDTWGFSFPKGGDWAFARQTGYWDETVEEHIPPEDPSWYAWDLADPAPRAVPLPSDLDDCWEISTQDGATYLFTCSFGADAPQSPMLAIAGPLFDSVSPATPTVSMSLWDVLGNAERFQVDGTPLIVEASIVTSGWEESASITALGVLTTDGYREFASFGDEGLPGLYDCPYACTLDQHAPGLFILNQGASIVLVIDIVTGRVITYGADENWALNHHVSVHVPYTTSR